MLEYKILEKDYCGFLSEKAVREHLKLPDYIGSDLVKDLIQCSIDAAENFLRFALVKQTVAFKCKFSGEVKLPIRYFSKMNKLSMSTEDGKEVTVKDYKVTFNKLHIDLPLCLSMHLEAEYVAEYPSLLPADIKQGVFKHMSDIYDKGSLSLGESVISLYQTYKIMLL
jgi:hypothetical protein